MKVRLVGAEWKDTGTVSFEELFHRLASIGNNQINFSDRARLIYIAERDGYHVGVFLTCKDQRRVCEIQQQRGEYKISVRALARGKSLVDFNFFAIHNVTGRGLYQHYHHSSSLNQFGLFLRKQFDDIKRGKREVELAQAGGDEAPRGTKKAINARYKGTLQWAMMVRTEQLQELLEQLKRIRSFEFEFLTLTEKESLFTPLSSVVKTETHRLSFKPKVDPGTIVGSIVSFVRARHIRRGRVDGVDEDGVDRVFRILDNPDCFAEFEFEELAEEAKLDLGDIARSPILIQILEVISKHRHQFETPT
jgi:hypothetical protein